METAKQRASRFYYEANKQKISEKRKIWYINNRETAIERVKAYQKLREVQARIKIDGPVKVSFE
jgi:hypothetical protein